MCFGGRGSGKDPGQISDSQKKDGKNTSVLSDPRSRTGASMHSSLMSSTGPSTMTGGGQSMDNPLMTSPLTGTITHESDPLPSELTAKSPQKESGESNKSRERKSIDVNPNVDTWRSTKDEETLKNMKESRRDMTMRGKDETEIENSEWSVMKENNEPAKKRKEKGGPIRSLFKPRPPLPPTRHSLHPKRPPPQPSPPPIPSIPIQPYRPPPIIPSPSTTPPTFPSLLNQSDEKTAINNQTLRTQRTMMDEETISRMQTPPLPKNQKDISYEVETRVPLSTLPPEEGPKLMEESKKLSIREDFKVLEEKTAHLIPEPSTKRDMCSKKNSSIEVSQMKG